jgi:hypothetical protein
MTTALGQSAIVGTLTADTINYTTLNPSITGTVTNPLGSDLLGAGNNIDLQGGDLTAATINYTSLNPPLPTGTVTNPMTSPLDGGAQNILNVADVQATSGTIPTFSSTTATMTTAVITNAVVNNNIAVAGAVVGGALTSTGTTTSGGRLTASAGLDITGGAQNQISNRTTFNSQVKFLGANYGTIAAPIQLGQVGQPTYKSFAAAATEYTIRVLGQDASGGAANSEIIFDVETTHPNFLENYIVDIKMTTADFNGLTPVPSLISPCYVGPSQLDPGNSQKFSVITDLRNTFTQTLAWTITFYYYQ